ncbi:MAG TPA: type IV pilus secretin PilQ [Chiayiivirga sp.]|nr:type IV pilus secretin PilQ [Chiayiivirga sp.]
MTSTKYTLQGLAPRIKHGLVGLVGALALMAGSQALANTLQDISYATATDGSVRIVLHLAEPATGAQTFTTDDPPRIAIDLPDTTNSIADRRIVVGSGATSAISAVEAGGRTRVVVDLFDRTTHQAYADGSTYVIDIAPMVAGTVANTTPGLAADPAKRVAGVNSAISNVDFRRTPAGAAQIRLQLTRENALVDLHADGQRINIDLQDVDVPANLRQKLDVTDFATPVQGIETTQNDKGTRVAVTVNGAFETMAYQSGNEYVLEVSPKAEPVAAADGSVSVGQPVEKGYDGKPVTFNFQDIPVRTVLNLIGEQAKMNIVVADSVSGNVTLRLINVPWDQVLEIVLRAKNLDKRSDGNVIWVAPQADIAKYEKALADARMEMEQRAELTTEYIPVNYGRAEDIAKLLTEEAKTAGQGGQGGGQSGGQNLSRGFLSPRGSVTFDPRTNTLLLSETAEKIKEIKELIKLLDRPVDQVLIEARIVIATESFARELGARFGISSARQEGNNTIIGTSGSVGSSGAMIDAALANRLNGRPPLAGIGAAANALNVNMPITSPAGAIGFSILGADYLLDLELSALQQEGRGEVISSPRVITSNQREAVISQGQEVGYITMSGQGGQMQQTVNFKEALLKLKVTPTITQDGRVFLNLTVNKDEITGWVRSQVGDTPELAKREVTTAVLVESGQTVVIGGVYEFTSSEDIKKVPFLGDVPILGNLFRTKSKGSQKAELLIFVSPKILNVAGPGQK